MFNHLDYGSTKLAVHVRGLMLLMTFAYTYIQPYKASRVHEQKAQALHSGQTVDGRDYNDQQKNTLFVMLVGRATRF